MTHRDGSRELEIIDLYESWDPDEESVSQLVDRMGISRQRLYQVLDKHGVVPKTKRGPSFPVSVDLEPADGGHMVTYRWPHGVPQEIPIGWRVSGTVVGITGYLDGEVKYIVRMDETNVLVAMRPITSTAMYVEGKAWIEGELDA